MFSLSNNLTYLFCPILPDAMHNLHDIGLPSFHFLFIDLFVNIFNYLFHFFFSHFLFEHFLKDSEEYFKLISIVFWYFHPNSIQIAIWKFSDRIN